MIDGEGQNNFNQRSLNAAEEGSFIERNKLVLTLALTVLSLFILGVQLLPYIYGGSPEHFHLSGACEWPDNCGKISSFVSF